MIKKLYPDAYINSVYDVDYKELYERGYRVVLFDIDNTLVLHDAPCDDKAKALFSRIHEAGLKTCLISNNDKERVSLFASAAGADSYVYKAHKPLAEGYHRLASELGFSMDQAIFFGDQLFTDVLGAKNAGIYGVMVKRIGKEKLLKIKVKRVLEKPIMNAYMHSKRFKNEV